VSQQRNILQALVRDKFLYIPRHSFVGHRRHVRGRTMIPQVESV
jgi:hypothetical protein